MVTFIWSLLRNEEYERMINCVFWFFLAFPEMFSHKATVAPERQIKQFSLCTCNNQCWERMFNLFMDSIILVIGITEGGKITHSISH